PPANMRAAMILFSVLCIAIGIWPEPLYRLLPHATGYEPYTAAHVLTQLQLLLFSGLAFYVVLDYLKRPLVIADDAEWLFPVLAPALWRALCSAYCEVRRSFAATWGGGTGIAERLLRWFGPAGLLGRAWSTGATALWMMVLLLAD